MASSLPTVATLPSTWPYRADPPGRYWNNYRRYQMLGGQIRLEEEIKGFTNGAHNAGDISRFYFFCVAFDQLIKENINGDLAELGVYRGNTATLLANMARRTNATAWLLDTFEGFNAGDLQGVDANRRLEFEDTSLDAVRSLVGEDNVKYIKGYFPESASQISPDARFSLVHIDCDLYVPIKRALEFFYPRLVPGGYLIVHDYGSLGWDGAERAVDEFFSDKSEAIIPLTDGGGSVVIRKSRPASRKNWLMDRRSEVLAGTWVEAGLGKISHILESGWSDPEHWGVWGVDECHTLRMDLYEIPVQDIQLELDVRAALLSARPQQEIAIFVSGKHLTTWEFSATFDRGTRIIKIPVNLVTVDGNGYGTLRVEFRPRSVAMVKDLDPTSADLRKLGMALYRIRRISDRD